MDHSERAAELFLQGYNCAQSLFGAFCDVTGLDLDFSLKMMSSMGGGMGRLREVCGACTGMFLVAGIVCGYEGTGEDGSKAEHYARIQYLANEFKKKHNTYICRELLESADVEASTDPTPEKRTADYYHKRACVRYIEDAARILDRFLEEQKEKTQN